MREVDKGPEDQGPGSVPLPTKPVENARHPLMRPSRF